MEQPEAWPESVRSGVTLLAWMVSREYLEVRVAFRVHGETGKPLSLEAVEDGYVHEKWFILHDVYSGASGQRSSHIRPSNPMGFGHLVK